MNLVAAVTAAAERAPMPDAMTRAGISYLVGRTRRRLAGQPPRDAVFAADMARYPIAEHTDAANSQHYEVPAAFFADVLGPHRKYSCCLYPDETATLADAEAHGLRQTAAYAGLADGQRILELGCGWGSLSLFMAQAYPSSHITAVSNSRSQRSAILGLAAERGLTNLDVVTADMNVFEPEGRFDRIVSVEMFEHMANWRPLLARMRGWLTPGGRAFLHVFSHRSHGYRFDRRDAGDWIAQHFFTGGIMPSHALIRQFPDLFEVEEEWRWNGRHYQRTALDWLANFDAHSERIDPILRQVYGADAALWRRRWRLFFLATAGLFGDDEGNEWAVSHYRLRPVAQAGST